MLSSNAGCASPATVKSNVAGITVMPAVAPGVSITANSTDICGGKTIRFTATPTNGGSLPFYQWVRNEINAGPDAPTYSTSELHNGDSVYVMLTSNAGCANPATVKSNIIKVTGNNVRPAIAITGNTIIDEGNATIIMSTIINGGPLPAFQWQDSTDLHSWLNISGATDSIIEYAPSQTSRLRCLLTSNDPCADPIVVTSNILGFTVNSNAGNLHARLYPNPVNTMVNVVNLDIADKWEQAEIRNLAGALCKKQNIEGQTSFSIPVAGLPGGMYILVLRRPQDKPVYLKFFKY